MLVAGADVQPTLLDFFVAAPAAPWEGPRGRCTPSCCRSTCPSATPSRCSTSARPRAASTAPPPASARRSAAGARCRCERLAAPAAALARDGRRAQRRPGLRRRDPRGLLTSTPECAALWAPGRARPARGRGAAQPRARRRAGAARRARAPSPSTAATVADAVGDWLGRRGGLLCAARTWPATERSRASRVQIALPRPRDPHQPAALRRGHAARLLAGAARPRPEPAAAARGRRGDGGRPVRAHPRVPRGPRRTRASPSASSRGRLGSTTHISVLDADGRACSATCTNGEGSGVVVPGTGLHLNNVMGEEDLNPLGFHRHRRRPADAEHDGPDRRDARRRGRAGARQRRLQPHPLGAAADDRRRRRPRPRRRARRSARRACTSRTGSCSPSRGSTWTGLARELQVVRFGSRNLFFGGVQAVAPPGRRARGRRRPPPRRRGGAALRAAGGLAGGRCACWRAWRCCGGCGGVTPADLFIVTRTGSTPHAASDPAGRRRRQRPLQRRAAPRKLSDAETRARPRDPGRTPEPRLPARDPGAAAGLGDELRGPRRKRHRALRRQLRRPAEGPARTGAVRAEDRPAGLRRLPE